MTTPIPIEWQPPSVLLDQGHVALCKRFYVDINTGGQALNLVIIVDDNEYPIAEVVTPYRQTVEVAFQVSGRVYSIRLAGSISTAQVEWFESWVELDASDKPVPLNINADNRLWLTGARNDMPPGTLRRAVGVAPELTGSVMARWGCSTLYPIAAITVFKWMGNRYAYDGHTLYLNGVSIQPSINEATGAVGFTGGRLTFVTASPQPGLPEYLFILGGGIPPFKIAPDGTVTLWGIQAPSPGATASAGVPDVIAIDEMTVNNTTNWTIVNGTLSFDSSGDDPFLSGGCYKIATGNNNDPFPPWYIQQNFISTLGAAQDWSEYPSGGNSDGARISLQSDIISFYAKFSNLNVHWLWILVDVRDGTFKKDFYKLVIQIVATTSAPQAAAADVVQVADVGRWLQLGGAKAQFHRIGTALQYDWSNVQAIRIYGGDPANAAATIHLNGLQLQGGYPLGIGPQALLGGSEYQYAVTFGNSITGSDSNPAGMEVQPDGSVNPPTPFIAQGIALEPVFLSNLPLATDPQVDNRKLWRTTAGGALFSYLDTIPDNTTTTYEDVTGDLPGQPVITTPWLANVSVLYAGYKVDGGNGFWFYSTNTGTTGAHIPPWTLPTGAFLGDWVPWVLYSVGDWVNYQGVGYYCTRDTTSANQLTPPSALPLNWGQIGATNDNGVIWVWGGLNAVRTLALSNNLLYDNQAPQESYGDAAGPWEGSIIWCRDSTPGRVKWVYFSPPGRPESVGTSIVLASGDASGGLTQKAVLYDEVPFIFTTKSINTIEGSYPALSAVQVKGGLGTEWPYTVVVAQNGIYYRAPDGIRMVDRAGSILAGFQAIGNILRGRTSENVAPFYPVWGALTRNEIFWGDGTVTFALGGQSAVNLLQAPVYVWRMLGQALNCAFYEKDDDEILASFGANTLLFENPGSLDDGH